MKELLFFLIAVSLLVLPASAVYTINNNATGGDCTTIGTWNAGTLTCTLTQDITQEIDIKNASITLDGAGFKNTGTQTQNQFGVSVVSVNNITIKNINIINYWDGIDSGYDNAVIQNNTISNGHGGICVAQGDNQSLLNNIISNQSSYGINLNFNSVGHTVIGNKVTNSGFDAVSNAQCSGDPAGIYIAGAPTSGHLIYNNYFNNTQNVIIGALKGSRWNTTKTLGTNIINGLYLAGNYWAQPNGAGFSQTCTDADGDGICDSVYDFSRTGSFPTVDIDYLPLRGISDIICPIGWCYLAGITNKTLLELDAAVSDDTIQGRYNSTSKQYQNHRTGYSFNENVIVSPKEGYYYYFTAPKTITPTPGSTPSIILKQGWNLVGNYGSSARTLAELKLSIGATATKTSYYDKALKKWIDADNRAVPAMESFMAYVITDTVWAN